ncbi:YecA family protein [Halobacillus andaensis]|uniref:YecA family protein n=1 Tax=Halobacillus andaensis TaxID=1176239 RepID=UPI003D744118
MTKVGRNDPCPCGSGKKYKKCHGESNVIEFPTKLVEEELDQHFLKFQDYMFDQYPHLFPRSKPTTDEEEVEQFIRLLYKGLFEVQKGGATIFQQYMDKHGPAIRRPSAEEAIRSWDKAKASIFKLMKFDGQSIIEVEDLLFGGVYKADRDRVPLEVEDFETAPYLTGIMLNYGPIYKFAPMAVPVEEKSYELIKKELNDNFKNQNEYDSLKDYFHQTFLEQLPKWIYFDENTSREVVEYEVIEILNQYAEEELKEEKSFQRIKEKWVDFCEEEAPIIRKPAVFAASLEYYLKVNLNLSDKNSASKKEVADKYNVSPNSISKRHEELENYFELSKS